jgi:hypothetical protein
VILEVHDIIGINRISAKENPGLPVVFFFLPCSFFYLLRFQHEEEYPIYHPLPKLEVSE